MLYALRHREVELLAQSHTVTLASCCLPNIPCPPLYFLTSLAVSWKRKQLTPVFLPGESHGQRSLAGSSPWGCKESDTTDQLKLFQFLDSVLKSRDITLPTKVHIVKALVFPIVMYGCESWTIKKNKHQRIDAFELWCWRRLLRVPWTARRSNPSILKEINPEYSLEGLMLKLKLQYFGYLMRRSDSLEKTLILGKIEGRKRRG